MTSAPSVLEIRALPGTDTYRNLLAQVAEGARDRDLDDENPFDQVRLLKEAGFGRLRIPTELGGAGLSVRQLFSAIIDVAQADPIVAHIFRTHFWFVEERLRTLADPVSAAWLTKVNEGNLFANAFSEKGSLAVGSLVFNTRLLPVGDAYRLNGEKFYSTGTLFADYLTVTATTDRDSVASVIVPGDRDGVRLVDTASANDAPVPAPRSSARSTSPPMRSSPKHRMTQPPCPPLSTLRCSSTSWQSSPVYYGPWWMTARHCYVPVSATSVTRSLSARSMIHCCSAPLAS